MNKHPNHDLEATPNDPSEDEMWLRWKASQDVVYDDITYSDNSLVSYVNKTGHRLVERPFGHSSHFSRVLEVGAGSGIHLNFVRHRFDEYHLTDVNNKLLRRAHKRHSDREGLVFHNCSALDLDYADESFDRVISIYTLEHLATPHLALKEWRRVLKPGGILSISIPTEGGIAWNLGRFLTTRRSFRKIGLDLDYIIAREHVNACYRLVAFIRHYFPSRRETWFPFYLPVPHINLIFATTIQK